MVFRAKVDKPFPLELALFMRDLIEAHVFIETGTYKGTTARFVAKHFKRVITVEGVEQRYLQLFQQTWPHNVEVYGGDSAQLLAEEFFATGADRGRVLWLDAHWFHNGLAFKDDPLAEGISPCPLLGELGAISINDCIIIDDAMFFLAPPPGRRLIKDWPTLDEIIIELAYSHYMFLYRETLCAVPNEHKDAMVAWLYDHYMLDQTAITYRDGGQRYITPESFRKQLRGDLLNE